MAEETQQLVPQNLPELRKSPAKVAEQTQPPNPELRFEMSPGIGKLIEALAKARKKFLPIIKAETNPFFKSKYADLAAVIDATKDGLCDNGLAVLQPPVFDRKTGTVEIITLLAHTSGEWIKSILDMPVAKTDAQGVGSAITYGRRYSYSALLNVASEADDDGNAAAHRSKGEQAPAVAMTDERLIECQDWLNNCETVEDLAMVFGKVYKEATALSDKDAMKSLLNVKDARKAKLVKA